MNFAQLVHDYGYLAVFVGTFFEGELIMLAAGMAASAGLLDLSGVVLAGMAGIFASDTVCFLLGRLAGERLKRWFPGLHGRLGGVFRLIEKHDDKLIVYFQFFPGLCTITPVAFGLSRIPVGRFMALDLLGNALWTLVFSIGGFAFGAAFGRFVAVAHEWLGLIAAVAVSAGAVLWWFYRRLFRRLVRVD